MRPHRTIRAVNETDCVRTCELRSARKTFELWGSIQQQACLSAKTNSSRECQLPCRSVSLISIKQWPTRSVSL